MRRGRTEICVLAPPRRCGFSHDVAMRRGRAELCVLAPPRRCGSSHDVAMRREDPR